MSRIRLHSLHCEYSIANLPEMQLKFNDLSWIPIIRCRRLDTKYRIYCYCNQLKERG